MVNDEHDTTTPDAIDVVTTTRFAALVPTLPSITTVVPSDL